MIIIEQMLKLRKLNAREVDWFPNVTVQGAELNPGYNKTKTNYIRFGTRAGDGDFQTVLLDNSKGKKTLYLHHGGISFITCLERAGVNYIST